MARPRLCPQPLLLKFRSPGTFWDTRGFAVFLDRAKEKCQRALAYFDEGVGQVYLASLCPDALGWQYFRDGRGRNVAKQAGCFSTDHGGGKVRTIRHVSQCGDIHRNSPRLVLREQLGWCTALQTAKPPGMVKPTALPFPIRAASRTPRRASLGIRNRASTSQERLCPPGIGETGGRAGAPKKASTSPAHALWLMLRGVPARLSITTPTGDSSPNRPNRRPR
jgi:hypothetical protein